MHKVTFSQAIIKKDVTFAKYPFGDVGVQCYFASIVMTDQMLQVLDEWQQWHLSG